MRLCLSKDSTAVMPFRKIAPTVNHTLEINCTLLHSFLILAMTIVDDCNDARQLRNLIPHILCRHYYSGNIFIGNITFTNDKKNNNYK